MEDNMIKIDFSKLSVDGIRFLYIIYSDLGLLHNQKNDYNKALRYFREVVELFNLLSLYFEKNPDVNDSFLTDMGSHVSGIKKNIEDIKDKLFGLEYKDETLEKEIHSYNTIFYYGVDDYEVYYKIGNHLRQTGANISALYFLDRALKLNPARYDILKTIGDIYKENINDFETAIKYYNQYVEACPNNKDKAFAYNTMGHLYERISQYQNIDKQIECFEKALEILPDLKSAIRNLTVVYPRAERELDAVKCFEKLFKLGATMDDYFDYAALKIKLKDFKEGWKYYEYRFSKESGKTVYPKINKPKWRGQKIPGKTLLVQYEQGFGDSIQFLRYLEQVKPLVGKIIFRVQNELVELFKLNVKDIEIVGMSKAIEDLQFDYHVALMSLMHFLNTTVDNIPMAEGYIKADENKIKNYKNKFFDNDCLKIGISWQGAAIGNKRRNIPFETFYPLAKMKNVKVYSFQKDASVEMKNLPYNVQITDLGSTFKDFSDTAGAMANIDLFVTSDNAVFQLAAAMGKKTFLLLSKDAEWRWFFDDQTTPWYSSVKIFKKQNELDNWDTLITRVMETISTN